MSLPERILIESERERLWRRLVIPPPELCTDNAVMGAIAVERYQAGLFESLELEVFPGLER